MMRKSLRRWLLHRRGPKMKPLIQRIGWFDFAGRMHRAIDVDVRVLLGEVTRADLARQQATKPLPRISHNAPTVAMPPVSFYADETLRVPCSSVDENATELIETY
jgi:hypothetical protein